MTTMFRSWGGNVGRVFAASAVIWGIVGCTGGSSGGGASNVRPVVEQEAGQVPPAEVSVQAAVVVKPVFSAQDGVKELERTIKFLKDGQFAQAEANLDHLITLRTDLPEAYFNLAWARYQLRKFGEIPEVIHQGLKLRPNEVKAWLLLALAERELGRFKDAEASYQALLAIDPKNQQGYLNQGILYDLYLQQADSALQSYRAYQNLQSAPDKRVAGWIAVLERRKPRIADPVAPATPDPKEGGAQ